MGALPPNPPEYFGNKQACLPVSENTPAGGAFEEEAKPDDETKGLRAERAPFNNLSTRTRVQTFDHPPSITCGWPVVNEDSSDAR
jgi:hypothetical protein